MTSQIFLEVAGGLGQARFEGAEPLTDPACFDLCNKLRKLYPSIDLEVVSPGTVFDKKVSRFLKKHRPRLVLSIDSLDRKIYEKLRPEQPFDRMSANLISFLAFSRKWRLPLAIVARVTPDTWRSLPDVVNFCNQCELTFVARVDASLLLAENRDEVAAHLLLGLRPPLNPTAEANTAAVSKIADQLRASP